jgi:hypothetical protein
MGTWNNSDGLYIRYGTDEADTGVAGEYRTNGPQRMVEVEITMLPLATGAAIQDDNVWLPAGARIEKVEVVTKTAVTSSGSGTLNVGLIRKDRTTELDYDGLIAAAAVATFNAAGETLSITAGGTAAGALLGTTLSYAGYLTADYDTADFTAGVIDVRIYWSKQ